MMKRKGDSIRSHPLKILGITRLLLPEIPLQQALERLAVPGFVAGHFMDRVVDGVQVQGLGALGQVGLAGGGAVLPALSRWRRMPVNTDILRH